MTQLTDHPTRGRKAESFVTLMWGLSKLWAVALGNLLEKNPWNIIVAENGMTGDVYEEGRVSY